MKLFNANLSPWASRCRIQIYAKRLDVEIVDAPGGLGSPEYKKLNPTGKVPALDAGGRILPESAVICEYLEERFPTPALLPKDALDRARVRLLVRYQDTYVAPPLSQLFGQLNPATRDGKVVERELGNAAKGFDYVESEIDAGPYAALGALSLADCALAPGFFFISRLFPMLGQQSPLEKHPKLSGWWNAIQKDAHVARVLDEMGKAMAARFGGGR